MASDIEVAEQCAKVTAHDFDVVGDALREVDFFVRGSFDGGGGEFVTRAGQQFDNRRAFLSQQYAGLATTLDDAGTATLQMWKEFERTTEEQVARFNAAKKDALGIGAGGGPLVLGPGGVAVKPPAITTQPHPAAARASVDPGRLLDRIHNPHVDTGWIDALNTWNDVKGTIDDILGFGWLVGPLSNVGIHVPIDHFRQWMEGNYHEMAEEAAKYFALSDFFEVLSDDMDSLRSSLEPRWLGLSSAALQDWAGDLSGAASYHRGQLNMVGSQIVQQGTTLKLILDQVLDVIEDLADCIPIIEANGEGLIEKGLSILKGLAHSALRAIRAAIRFVAKFVLKFELLLDAVEVFLTVVGSGSANLELAPITRPATR